MAGTGSFGYYSFSNDGIPSRPIVKNLNQKALDLQGYELARCENWSLLKSSMSWCNNTKDSAPVDYILWGDSHAEHLFPGLKKETTKNWMLVGRHSCPPVLGIKVWLGTIPKNECEDANNKSIAIIKENSTNIVALAALGPLYFQNKGYAAEHAGITDDNINNRFVLGEENEVTNKVETFKRGLYASIEALTAAGKKIVIIKDVPEFPINPKACLIRPFKTNVVSCDISIKDYNDRTALYAQIIEEAKTKYKNVYIFDAASSFCNADKCSPSDNEHIYFRDGHHLSIAGSEKVAESLIDFINKIE
jgi:ribosomal protein S11